MATYKKNTPEWREENFPICKEALKGMMDNQFIKNAKRIKEICYEGTGCDVGVGVDKFIAEKGINRQTPGLSAEIREFLYMHRKFTLNFMVEVLATM